MLTMPKEILENRDVEKFKDFISFDELTEIQKDGILIDFDMMCKQYHKEFNTPTEYLEYGLKKYIDLAKKYNLNFMDLFNKAAIYSSGLKKE